MCFFKKILLRFIKNFKTQEVLALFHEFHCVSGPEALALFDLALALFHEFHCVSGPEGLALFFNVQALFYEFHCVLWSGGIGASFKARGIISLLIGVLAKFFLGTIVVCLLPNRPVANATYTF